MVSSQKVLKRIKKACRSGSPGLCRRQVFRLTSYLILVNSSDLQKGQHMAALGVSAASLLLKDNGELPSATVAGRLIHSRIVRNTVLVQRGNA